MEEQTYRTMKSAGSFGIVIGIVSIVVGVTVGILNIVNGSRLLKKKSDIMF